jgi:hypothetical protein
MLKIICIMRWACPAWTTDLTAVDNPQVDLKYRQMAIPDPRQRVEAPAWQVAARRMPLNRCSGKPGLSLW